MPTPSAPQRGNVIQLRTRRPTGRPSWPLILLAGEAKTGKTHRAAEFTGDPRLGRCFWLDLGEGCADEYGVVPGANYVIIDHDGTWVDIIEQVAAVKEFAAQELARGEKPVCLVIDSMTAEWAMLSEWTQVRAKRSKNNMKLLAEDPDAEIDVTSNYWNDANSRHNRLMNLLKTFPGIVVLTSLETEKTQFGPGGRPLEKAPKVAKPDAQKRLPADVNVWIRLSLTEEPVVVGMRYPTKMNIIPGKKGEENQPKPWPDFTLGKLVFEFLGIGAGTTQVRNTPTLNADQRVPGEDPAADERAERDERARAFVTWALGAADAKTAGERSARLATHQAKDIDVLPYLAEETRERLGVHPDAPMLALAELGRIHESYVARHGRSVLAPLDDDAPTSDAAPATGEAAPSEAA